MNLKTKSITTIDTILNDTEEYNPKLRPQTYLEVCVDDAMYNAPYEVMIQHGKGSEYAGWGLQRPQSFMITYQRLWEYYVNMEIYMAAVWHDYHMTNVVPNMNPTFAGVGFEHKQVGEEDEN